MKTNVRSGVFLVVLLMAVLLCFSGCATLAVLGSRGEAKQSSAPAPAAEATPTAEPTPPAVPTPEPVKELVKQGEMFAFGDWEVTVDSSYRTASVRASDDPYNMLFFEPDAGSEYFCVELSVKNLGKTSAQFLPTIQTQEENVSLILDGEYEYPTTLLLGCNYLLESTSINPLTTYSGILVFSVPSDVHGDYTLRLVKDGVTVHFKLQGKLGPARPPKSDGESPSEPFGGVLTQDEVHPWGEGAVLGNWEISITDIQEIGIPDVHMAHDYAVEIVVTNLDSTAHTVGSDSPGAGDLTFSLIRNQVSEFSLSRERTDASDFWDTSVGPGEQVVGYARFTAEDDINSYLVLKAMCDGEEALFSANP